VGLPSIERTPDGRRLAVDRVVGADRDAAWDLLTDSRRWPEWGPSVTGVRSPGRYVAAGTTGEVQVAGGPWVSFRVDTCEDYRWTWSVERVPATGHFVRPDEAGSRVDFEMPVRAAGYAQSVPGRARVSRAHSSEMPPRPSRRRTVPQRGHSTERD